MPNVPETADQFYARDDDLLEAWHFMNISGSPNETPGGGMVFLFVYIYKGKTKQLCGYCRIMLSWISDLSQGIF